jgi:hypothetical protein
MPSPFRSFDAVSLWLAKNRFGLLDGVPLLAVRRDDFQKIVFIWPVAVAIPLRSALLHADLGDEPQVIEVKKLGHACLACFLARVTWFDAARGLEHRAQLRTRNLGGLGLAIAQPVKNHAVPELAARMRSIDNRELDFEHFAVAVLGALQHSIFAGTANAYGHFHGADCVRRNQVDGALFRSFVVIERHS